MASPQMLVVLTPMRGIFVHPLVEGFRAEAQVRAVRKAAFDALADDLW